MSQYDENLSENPFFQEIVTNNYDIIKRATQENWIICVPRIGNLEQSQISTDLILDHVLQGDSEDPKKFKTLSKKSVSLSGRQIVIENDHPTQVFNNVQILFEETHYTNEKSKYLVWCVDKTLFSDDISCGTNSKYVLKSLNDCIDFLWCESLGHNIFEQIQKIVAVFLEKHEEFGFENLQNQKELIGSVYSQCLQVALKNDHLSKKSSDTCFFNNVKVAVEAYMQNCFSNKLLTSISTNVCEFDAHLNKIIQNSSEIQLKDLGISTNFCDIITRAKCELNNLNRFKSVLDKLNCLRSTFQIISSSEISSVNDEHVSTDVLLQIFIFIILKLRINNWVSNLTYLKHFQFSYLDASNENSFLISTFEAAIEYIRSNDFLDTRANLMYNESVNDQVTSSLIMKAFKYVRTGQLEDLANLLSENKIYEPPEIKLCHPLCCCENCLQYVQNNGASENLTIESVNDKEQTLLHIAALYGHCDIVEYLLAHNADVNCRDFLGRTPLHYAAVDGLQGVLLLFTNSSVVNVNIKDNNGNTPLILAANNGHDNCVKALLYSSVDIDVNSCNNYGDTALHLASKWGYVSIVQILLENNASSDIRNKRNQTAMSLAQNSYVIKLLKQFQLVQNERTACNSPVNFPDTLSINNDYSLTENDTAEHGIKPKYLEQMKKIELLLKSIQNNDLPLTCFYLGFCSATVPNDESEIENKCHPLCNCDKCYALERDYEIISLPKSSEYISVNFCNQEGYTPLHIAALYGRTEILRLLLDSGALPNLKTFGKSQTALHLASINQRLQIVKILVTTASCDINAKDAKGNTALFYACINNDVRIAELLLSNGADHHYRNNDGKTILEEVHDRMLYRVFKLLRNYSQENAERYEDNESLFI